MNNSFKIVLIVFLSFLLISFSGLFIVLLNNTKINDFSFGFNFGKEQNLAFEKEYSGDYSKINVNSNIGDVKFIKSDNSTFSVKLYAENDKDFEVSENNGELVIEYLLENKANFFRFKTPRIEIYVPNNYSGKFNIKANSGDLKIDSFDVDVFVKINTGDINVGTVKSIDATTNTGDIKLNSAKDISLVSTTGDINVSTTNNAVIKSKTGDITIDTITGDIQISTGTGDVSIGKLNITNNSTVTSNTGDIVINSTNEIYIESKTNTGDTKINNNYRDAKYKLKLKTNTGDITVNN